MGSEQQQCLEEKDDYSTCSDDSIQLPDETIEKEEVLTGMQAITKPIENPSSSHLPAPQCSFSSPEYIPSIFIENINKDFLINPKTLHNFLSNRMKGINYTTAPDVYNSDVRIFLRSTQDAEKFFNIFKESDYGSTADVGYTTYSEDNYTSIINDT